MECLEKINNKLEEIEKEEFSLDTLRAALLVNNYIARCFYTVNPNKMRALMDTLESIMRKKFLEVDPNLSECILKKILCAYHRGSIIIPKDIMIIADGVFVEEDIMNDFWEVYKTKTYLVEVKETSKDGYKEVNSVMYFWMNSWEEAFDSIFLTKPWQEKYERGEIVEFITDSINKVLDGEVVTFGEHTGGVIDYCVGGINIYLDHNYDQICEALYYQREENIKMITQNYKNEFHYYEIVQSVSDEIPVWSYQEKEKDIWRLSTALKKKQNKPKRLVKNDKK